MFKKILNKVGLAAKVIAPIAITMSEPAVLINNGVAAIIKHATKIDNQTIPGLNVIASSGAIFVKNALETGSWGLEGILPALTTGSMLAAGSTATHQGTKIVARQFTGKSI